MTESRTAYRTCPLCEATCGLELRIENDAVTRVRGDRDDVFSHGFLCPKGSALGKLDADPDRIRVPQIRTGEIWRDATWSEAFAAVDAGLGPILAERGRDAVAVYLGNPNAHNLAGLLYARVLIQTLGSKNFFSASTVDQMPKSVAAGLMFGTMLSIPVPDIDRTDLLVIMGANPHASNGSLLTAPDLPGRLEALRGRGGTLVVVDPRRTTTADAADEHHFIRPGTDALFLFAIVHTLFAEGLVRPGAVEPHLAGIDEIRELAQPFSPETVAPACGVDASAIRHLARELATTERAAVYARIGTCTQEFGTTASWLVDVVNTLAGNLDRPGGAMFPRPVAGAANTAGRPGSGRGVRLGRYRSRVRGFPETFGEFPVVTLADEMEVPGPGQVRALVTLAGNPALSTPDSRRLDAALAGLDFMVSVDIYRNETTRHANVILPVPGALTRGHYDLALYSFAIRNVANYSPPTVELAAGEMHEWEILLRLAAIVGGAGPDTEPGPLDDLTITTMVAKAVGNETSPIHGRDSDEILAALATRRGPERLLDFMIRTGPYGDAFGAVPDGATLAMLEANPHGVDFGPLEPRIPEMLRTPTGRIELAPPELVADVPRLRATLDRHPDPESLVLIGRRHLRSNNSWMHNLDVLVKGRPRCTAILHPEDAARLDVTDGADVRISSRVGAVVATAEVSDEIMPGVVSLPHGWGHAVDGTRLGVASRGRNAGVNSNVLTDPEGFDPLSGNAVLNGIPVTVTVAVGADAVERVSASR